jgi:hypothetical protein
MTSTAKQEAEKIEILDHSMTRITVVADGSFDEFQAPIRCHDARFHSPGHRPRGEELAAGGRSSGGQGTLWAPHLPGG